MLATFPKQPWDGITPWRRKPEWNEPPQGRDMDEVIAEIMAIQRVLLKRAKFYDWNDLQDVTSDLQNPTGKVELPRGTFKISSTINLQNDVDIMGNGTILIVPAGFNFNIFDSNSKSGWKIRNLKIIVDSGVAGNTGYGIVARGNSQDILIENYTTNALQRGIQTGDDGVTAGTVKDIVCRKCRCDNSPLNFGFCFDDVDGVTLDTCFATGSWLDGAKLRRKTLNVTVRGGRFNNNGVSGAGDGMDTYAGGDTFNITDAVFENNTGSGLTIKSGDLNQATPAAFGVVKNIQLNNLRCRGNTAMGLYLTVNDPNDAAEPIVSGAIINGGIFEGGVNSMYILARNVTVNSPIIKKSLQHGIYVAPRAFDVEINDPLCIACGQQTVNTWYGIEVGGQHIRVHRGLFIGKDIDSVAAEADLTALTAVTRYGVHVSPVANNIFIDMPKGRHLASHTAEDDGTGAGVVIINQVRTGDPNLNGAYGTLGSRYYREYASAGEDGYLVPMIKVSGGRNTPTSGWAPMIPYSPVAALPAASNALLGQSFRLKGGTGVADIYYVCTKDATNTPVMKQFTIS